MASNDLSNQCHGEDLSADFSIIEHFGEMQFDVMQNMLNSSSSNSSMTIENIHACLIALSEDNKRLKARLKHTNAITEEKLQFLEIWNKDQKKKLAEANERILSLENENSSLQNKIIDYKYVNPVETSSISVQCSENFDASLNPAEGFELVLDPSKETSKLELDELKSEVKVLTDECNKKVHEIENMTRTNAEQNAIILKLEEEKRELLESKEAASAKLEEEKREALNAVSALEQKNQSQIEHTKLALDNLKSEIKVLTDECNKQVHENENMTRANVEKSAIILKLEEEKRELLKSQEAASAKFEEEKRKALHALEQKYNILQKELEECKSKLKKSTLSSNNQIHKLQEEVNNLTSAIMFEREATEQEKANSEEIQRQLEDYKDRNRELVKQCYAKYVLTTKN